MPDVNDQLRAAEAAKRTYQDTVRPLVEGTLEWIKDIAELSKLDGDEFQERLNADILAVERKGLLLSFGGPNCWLLWDGNLLYAWAGSGPFIYEPSSAAEEDSAKTLLQYFMDHDVAPTGED